VRGHQPRFAPSPRRRFHWRSRRRRMPCQRPRRRAPHVTRIPTTRAFRSA
jgi:hypothetical protein